MNASIVPMTMMTVAIASMTTTACSVTITSHSRIGSLRERARGVHQAAVARARRRHFAYGIVTTAPTRNASMMAAEIAF